MKKLVSVFMALAIVFTSVFAEFPLTGVTARAAATGIQAKIDTLLKTYPSDSYFTQNGTKCTHSQTTTCTNCKLTNIPSRNGLPAGKEVSSNGRWTCCAFATYVFYYIFGADYLNNSTDLGAKATPSVGDIIRISGHWAVCVGSAGTDKWYVYESNYTYPNMVKYKSPYTTISRSQITNVYHAKNYDAVNSGDDQSSMLKYKELDDGTLAAFTAWEDRYDIKRVTIPSSYNGKKVTQVLGNAFLECTNLTSVTIPDSVNYIGFDAFRSCTSLTSITIPNSVEKIMDRAFKDCSSLKTFTFPSKVTDISYLIFSGCTNLTSVKIPEGVTYISTESFLNCKNLTSVNIPDTVEYIRRNAFQNCVSLKSISIPVGVKTIYDGIILGSGVTDIYYGGSKAQWEQLVFEPNNEDVLAATIHYAVTEPNAVTGFSGTVNEKSIVLSWNKSANATEYKLQQMINGGWQTIASPTGTTYTVTGLKANTAYNFRIFARNNAGQSAQTKLTISTAIAAPAAVTGFMGVAESNSITLNWYKSANATSYKLQQSINGAWQTIASPTGTTYTVSGLKANTTYNFRIFARNSSGQSAQTKLTVTTTGAPAAVTGFIDTATADSIVLKWNKSANAAEYKLQQNVNGAWTTIASPTGTTYTVSGLKANTAYNFRIFARNSSGQSAQTKLTVTTTGAPTAVTGFIGTATADSIILKWNKSVNAVEYKLQQNVNGAWTTIASPTGTTYTVSGLKANTAYNFRIFARNGNMQSAQTKFTISTIGIPANVTGFSGSASANSITLKWNRSANAAEYKLQQMIDGSWQTISMPTGTTITIFGLDPKTTYNFRIFARNGSLQSEQSKLTVKTL